MIDPKIISNVRNSVCAIGWLSVPLEEYRKNIDAPYFQVLGTGFMVRKKTIITNQHVIQGLFAEQKKLSFPLNQLFLSFIVSYKESGLRQTIRQIREYSMIDDENLDVGFLDFKIVYPEHFHNIEPLEIASSFDLHPSEEVAIYGYPYGTIMLTKNDFKVHRWGPVIQQGYISAISPFDTTTIPDEILLDVRTAEGMSGSPIFKPSNGQIVGIHHSGIGATTAFGLPVTNEQIEDWLKLHDRNKQVIDVISTYSI